MHLVFNITIDCAFSFTCADDADDAENLVAIIIHISYTNYCL